MRIKRMLMFVLFAFVLVFLWTQLYVMQREASVLQERADALAAQATQLEEENARLARDLAYYDHPENIEKFLRSRFNYKLPGEKMIIVIPGE